MGRTHKHSGLNPNRGFKQISGIAARGFKHVGETLRNLPRSIANADSLTRKTANTLNTLGEYAHLASAGMGGHEQLSAVGQTLLKAGHGIHKWRRGDFANKLRKDFTIMDKPSSTPDLV
jgi:hypothetical protein